MKNVEDTKHRLNQQGIILSDRGLWINYPNVFPKELLRSKAYKRIKIDDDVSQYNWVTGCYSNTSPGWFSFSLSDTLPVFSSSCKRNLERLCNVSIKDYYVTVVTTLSRSYLYCKPNIRALDNFLIMLYFLCNVSSPGGSTIWGAAKWTVFVLSLEEFIIDGKSLGIVSIQTNVNKQFLPEWTPGLTHRMTIVDDCTIPMIRTDMVELKYLNQTESVSHMPQSILHVDLYERMMYEQASDTNEIQRTLINDHISQIKYNMRKGLYSIGSGVRFPLDKNPTFYFNFLREGEGCGWPRTRFIR